ncbi:migration and invasion-inhibitory protein isoform X2 [Esox lucius]|uniref:migration and invasion-inhibitory protein isoform X2 n=1 Tax=Esox lucius TaxID=8010 RepID=UPI000576D868|nr:migration and invasion-inhibitory protein isoform X2 [Esox lucius]
MSTTERLNTLRERNKDLLRQLRLHTERLLTITGTSFSWQGDSKRTAQKESTKGPGQIEGTASPAESMVTIMNFEPGTARFALGNPSAQFQERENIATQATIAPLGTGGNKLLQKSAEHTAVYTGLLQDRGSGHPEDVVRSIDIRRSCTRPTLFHKESENVSKTEEGRVTFQSPPLEQTSASDRHRLQPLLGYDWIAGIVDAESSLTERSEQFFSDLRTFRQVNRDECVHRQQDGLSEEDPSPPPLSIEEEGLQGAMDTHQCTFCYRINSRLFPTPLDTRESCSVCRKPKSQVPHTTAAPAFIRVSIPRSTLLPAYQYKAHRRGSFDPSDSLGLPSHCLSGWSNTVPGTGPQLSSLDLRSSVNETAVTSLFPSMQQQLDLSVSRVSGSQRSDVLLDVSRLARYRFQRRPHNSKPQQSTSYPVF